MANPTAAQSRFDAWTLTRPHLRDLTPYSSARDDFTGDAHVYLDANENPFGSVTDAPLNRYPDPHQREVKAAIATVVAGGRVDPDGIFVGNGSDEAIDLLVHAFCEPDVDHVITTPPTYGMYGVTAAVNNVAVRTVRLRDDFALDADAVIDAMDDASKLIFLCSPNNPTGNLQPVDSIVAVAEHAPGLVVVDEAYIDFAPHGSAIGSLGDHPNLVVLRTFSKAWGMAAARLGVALADPSTISVVDAIKMPYNVSGPAQAAALDALANTERRDDFVARTIAERDRLAGALAATPGVRHVHDSDANFLLATFDDATGTYHRLIDAGIIVRDRSQVVLCDDALRITVGTPQENDAVLAELARLPGRREDLS